MRGALSSSERSIGGSRGALRGFIALAIAACLIAPSHADSALDWIVSTITGQSVNIEQTAQSGTLSRGTVLQPEDKITTGEEGRVVLTHGRDVLELEPSTTIAVGESGPDGMTTVIKLIDGTVHVKVGKRAPGRTFSVETRYLVATVKGTQFDVTAADNADAVSVNEGTVSVRAAGTASGVDVTPGRTAVASSAGGAASVDTTPVGGAPAAAAAASKAAKGSQAASDSASTSQSNGNGNGKGNGNGNGNGNGHGNGSGNAGGNGNGNGGGNGGGNGNGNGAGNGHGGGHDRGRHSVGRDLARVTSLPAVEWR